jgi:hypothetical protein
MTPRTTVSMLALVAFTSACAGGPEPRVTAVPQAPPPSAPASQPGPTKIIEAPMVGRAGPPLAPARVGHGVQEPVTAALATQ